MYCFVCILNTLAGRKKCTLLEKKKKVIRNEVLIVKDLEIVVFISKLVRAGFDSRAVEKRKCFSPLLFW